MSEAVRVRAYDWIREQANAPVAEYVMSRLSAVPAADLAAQADAARVDGHVDRLVELREAELEAREAERKELGRREWIIALALGAEVAVLFAVAAAATDWLRGWNWGSQTVTGSSASDDAAGDAARLGASAESRPSTESVSTTVAPKMLSVQNRKSDRSEREAESCRSVVDLDNGARRYLAQHSSGMQEPADVARMLRVNPDVVLMGDPAERAVESEALRRFGSMEAVVRFGDQRA
ncbi:hypothetical protein [Candidatus Poriferisodalis sp.]|uniref:hypothetical protein n=1 Tax=Candidatus Poriferisodalis sp. TaxID=3101277 RepID=UPI003B0148DB